MMNAPPRAVLAFSSAQPKPVGLIVIHRPTETIITREWAEGDAARCRRCPTCGVTPRGTCTVVAPGWVDDASAAGHALVRSD